MSLDTVLDRVNTFLEGVERGLAPWKYSLMFFGGISVVVTLLAARTIGDERVRRREEASIRTIVGDIQSLDDITLNYDISGGVFGDDEKYSIPVTFVNFTSDLRNYNLVLSGQHTLRQGERVLVRYLPDSQVTGQEIWDRQYPGTIISNGTVPNVRYDVDGQVQSYYTVTHTQ